MRALWFELAEFAPQQHLGSRAVRAQTSRCRATEAVDGAELGRHHPTPPATPATLPLQGGIGACGLPFAHQALRSITIHPALSMRASKLAVMNVDVSSSAMIAGPCTRTPASRRERL